MPFNFIDYYTQYYRERESPEIFWKWSAIGCLAAILRDNIYLKVHEDVYFPNMYIILLADSGEYRKAAPCKAASKLIREIGNTKLVAGRTSMQAYIKGLGQDFTNDEGKLIRGASGVLYSEELSSLLVKDPATVPILIEIYDYHSDWDSNLISSGRFKLKDVCTSLIAASNSSMFSRIDTTSEDGLLGRVFVVMPKEQDKRPRKSLFELAHSQHNVDRTPLVNHLRNLIKMRGAVYAEKDAEEYYNNWYHSIPSELFSDKLGYGPRLGTHAFKVGLTLAAAREDFSKKLTLKDIIGAIDLCTSLRKNYKQIGLSTGLSSRSTQINLVVKILLGEKGYKITRAKLIQKTLGDIEGEILDSIMLYMAHADLIQEIAIGSSVGYKLTQKAINILLTEE